MMGILVKSSADRYTACSDTAWAAVVDAGSRLDVFENKQPLAKLDLTLVPLRSARPPVDCWTTASAFTSTSVPMAGAFKLAETRSWSRLT